MAFFLFIACIVCVVLAHREGKRANEAFISESRLGTSDWRLEHNWHHDEVRRLLIDGDRNKAKEVKASQAEYWKHANRSLSYWVVAIVLGVCAVGLLIF